MKTAYAFRPTSAVHTILGTQEFQAPSTLFTPKHMNFKHQESIVHMHKLFLFSYPAEEEEECYPANEMKTM